MAAITICSDFGAPQNKVWHCFHCFSIYFPWSDGTRCHDLSFLKLLQSCLILCDPMNCSPQGSSVHGILQARILEWVVMPSSRGSSWPRDRTHISYVYLHWQASSLQLAPPGKPFCRIVSNNFFFPVDKPYFICMPHNLFPVETGHFDYYYVLPLGIIFFSLPSICCCWPLWFVVEFLFRDFSKLFL